MRNMATYGAILLASVILGGAAQGDFNAQDNHCDEFFQLKDGEAISMNIQLQIKVKPTEKYSQISRADFEDILDSALENSRQQVLENYGPCFETAK